MDKHIGLILQIKKVLERTQTNICDTNLSFIKDWRLHIFPSTYTVFVSNIHKLTTVPFQG